MSDVVISTSDGRRGLPRRLFLLLFRLSLKINYSTPALLSTYSLLAMTGRFF